jgi:hypothetical protein
VVLLVFHNRRALWGVAMANDGSHFVIGDGSRSVWHVSYTGK